MSFRDYLAGRYRPATVLTYYHYWEKFTSYLEGLNLPLAQVDHPLMLEYVRHLQRQGKQTKLMNTMLNVIEQGFAYQQISSNPVQGLRIKPGTRLSVQAPVAYPALEGLLKGQPRASTGQKRDYILLSLVHYQALSVGDLNGLRVADVDLEKATLWVSSSKRSASREVLLQALQIKPLQDYLTEVRPKFKPVVGNNKLLLTSRHNTSLRPIVRRLNEQLSKQLAGLASLRHWRSSILVHWLEHTPLLEVQQRVGHRYASSTERYQIHAVKGLQEALKKHHPLKD